MRTLRKILAVVGMAGVLTLSVIWGTHSTAIQKPIDALADYIQKPGHLALADVVYIQKPGH